MSLVVHTVSDSSKAQQDLSRLNTSLDKIQTSVGSLTNRFVSMGTAIGVSVGGIMALTGVTRVTDTFTRLENRIKTVTEGIDEFKSALYGVKSVAVATRSDLDATASLFQRLQSSTRSFGASQRSVLTVTKLVSQTLKLSGASASEAAASLTQFGQAMGSSTLAGDELKSILENNQVLSEAIAKAFGVSVNKLKSMGEAGKLTSRVLFEGLVKQAGDIEGRFQSLSVTYEDAFKNLSTSLELLADSGTKIFSDFISSITGSGGGLASWINNLALTISDFALHTEYYFWKIKATIGIWAGQMSLFLNQFKGVLEGDFSSIISYFADLGNNIATALASGLGSLQNFAGVLLDKLGLSKLKPYVDEVLGSLRESIGGTKLDFSGVAKDLGLGMLKAKFGDFGELAVQVYQRIFKSQETLASKAGDVAVAVEELHTFEGDATGPYDVMAESADKAKARLEELKAAQKDVFDGSRFANFMYMLTRTRGPKLLDPINSMLSGIGTAVGSKSPVDAFQMESQRTLVDVAKEADFNDPTSAAKTFFEFIDESFQSVNGNGESFKRTLDSISIMFPTLSKGLAGAYAGVEVVVAGVKSAFGWKKDFAEMRSARLYTPASESLVEKKLPRFTKSVAAVSSIFGVQLGNVAETFNGFISKANLPILTSALDGIAKVFDNLLGFLQIFLKKTEASNLGRNIKQILGIRDTIPGVVYEGTENRAGIDTEGKVGRGPYRREENRPFLHDVMNALPKSAMVPVAAMITGAGVLGITAAFQEGFVRSAMVSAFTSGMALLFVKIIPDNVLHETMLRAGNTLMDLLSRGLDALFGGNVIKDPFGLLSLIAKTLLLFSAGRKFLGEYIQATAKAGTGLGGTVNDILQRRRLVRDAAAAKDFIPDKVKEYQDLARRSNARVDKAVNKLVGTLDASGSVITKAAAQSYIVNRNLNAVDTGYQKGLIASANVAALGNSYAQSSIAATQARAPAFDARAADLQRRADALQEQLNARKDQFRSSFVGNAGGLGGVVGGVAGFQFGANLAKTLTGSSEWVKLSVTMGAAFAGQVIASGVASVLASALLTAMRASVVLLASAFGTLRTFVVALNLPFLTGAVLIVAALTAGYALFKGLPEQWKGAIEGIKNKLIGKGEFDDVTTAELEARRKKLTEGDADFSVLGRKLQNPFSALKPANIQAEYKAQRINEELALRKSDAAAAAASTKYAAKYNPDGTLQSQHRSSLAASGNNGSVASLLEPLKKDLGGLARSIASSLGVDYDKTIKAATDLFSGPKDVKTPTPVSTGKTRATPMPESEKTLTPLNKMSDGEIGNEVARIAGISKVSGLTKDVYKGLDAGSRSKIADVVETIRQARAYADNPEVNSATRDFNAARVSEGEVVLRNLLRDFGASGKVPESVKPDASTDEEDKKDKQLLTFDDQLRVINDAFPRLSLSMEEFTKMLDEPRNALFNMAEGLAVKRKAISDITLGEIGKTKDTVAAARLKEISDATEASYSKTDALLAGVRNPGERLAQKSKSLEAFQVSISPDIARLLEPQEIESLSRSIDSLTSQFAASRASSDPQDFIKFERRRSIVEDYAKSAAASRSASSYASYASSKYGVQGIDSDSMSRMSKPAQRAVQKLLKDLQEAEKSLFNASESTQKPAEELVAKLVKQLRGALENGAEQAGEAFASEVKSNFSGRLAKMFAGEAAPFKDFGKDLSLMVTNTFSAGLSNMLMNPLMESLKSMGSELFGLSSTTAGLVGDAMKVFVTNSGGATTSVEGSATPLSDIWSSLKTKASGAINGVKNYFGFGGAKKDGEPAKPIADAVESTDWSAPFSKMTDYISSIKWGEIFGGLGTAIQNLMGLFGGGGSSKSSIFGLVMAGVQAWAGASSGTNYGAGGANGVAGSPSTPMYAATGGYIAGPGTGTSDSIHAKLSNGEFVINAAATSRHLDLLTAINNNDLPAFATGGLVGGADASSIVASVNAVPVGGANVNNTNSQTHNWNITGDVSRQTKKTIMELIPDIAGGVNRHNKEKGLR